MKTATAIFSILIFSIVGAFSTPALAVLHQEEAKKAAEHMEKGSNKARHDADKQRYEAAKPKKKAQKHDTKATQKEVKASYKDGGKKQAAQKNKSNATAQDKQVQKEQRRVIQDDYRAKREPGQEGTKGAGKPAKKPWWKFWQNSNATQQN